MCARRISTRSTRSRFELVHDRIYAHDLTLSRSLKDQIADSLGAWPLDCDPPEVAGFSPGFTAKDSKACVWFLTFDPRATAGVHRRGCRRDAALLGAGLQPGRILHHAHRSEADGHRPQARFRRARARRRARRDDLEAVLRLAARDADGSYRAWRACFPARLSARSVLAQARRSERHRAARAQALAAGAQGVRRVDEPGRHEGRAHARHRRRGDGRSIVGGTTCRTWLDVRHRRQRAATGTRV